MKTLSLELKDRLAATARTLCLCWRLVRRDEAVFGLTDHDHALDIDNIRFDPGAALSASRFAQSVDFRPGRADVEGVLSSAFITLDDLKSEVWMVAALRFIAPIGRAQTSA